MAFAPRRLLILERVAPAKSRESPEVGVIRMKFGLMLDRKGCQMKVRGQLSGHTRHLAERFQKIDVTVAGLDNLNLRPFKPRSQVSDRDERGQRGDQNATAAHDSDETEQNIPWKSHRSILAKGGLPPLFRCPMIRRIRVVRVDEQIHIRNQHLFTGPARSVRRLARVPVRRRAY